MITAYYVWEKDKLKTDNDSDCENSTCNWIDMITLPVPATDLSSAKIIVLLTPSTRDEIVLGHDLVYVVLKWHGSSDFRVKTPK